MSGINEQIKMTGHLKIYKNNELIRDVDNLVVTAGKGYVANRMKSDVSGGTAIMSHMAIGSGTTNPAAGNTAPETQLARVALTSTGISGAVLTYTATFGAGTGTGAVTEAAILNASSGGTMLCRTEFSVVNKGSSDSMTITWTVTVS